METVYMKGMHPLRSKVVYSTFTSAGDAERASSCNLWVEAGFQSHTQPHTTTEFNMKCTMQHICIHHCSREHRLIFHIACASDVSPLRL